MICMPYKMRTISPISSSDKAISDFSCSISAADLLLGPRALLSFLCVCVCMCVWWWQQHTADEEHWCDNCRYNPQT